MNRSLRTLAVVLAFWTLLAPATRADEGPGKFAVEAEEHVGDLQVRYVVRETFVNDGHPVRDATVTATAVAADGTAETPVPMTADGEGAYEGVVTFPSGGDWTVRFTSVDPQATLEHPVTVAAPATTTTTAAESVMSTTEPSDASSPDADDGDGSGAPIAILVAGLVIVVGVGVFLFTRSRR